jgi:Spy/CpxP family protein refolding chaperone
MARAQKENLMTSIRSRRFTLAPALAACLALAACAGEGATGSATALPPPPGSATPPPPPVAPPPMPAPVASTPPAPPAPPPNPQGAEMSEGQDHREQHHGGVQSLIVLTLKDLDLTADQQAAIDKIRTDLLASMEPARAAEKDYAGTLADGVAAGKVDRAKVDAAIGKLVTQVQGAHDASLAALNQLHATLTSAQRAKLVDELQEHWEKWKEAQGKDEADDKQHHAGHLLALVRDLGLTQEQADKIKAGFHDKMKVAPQDHAHKEVQDHLAAFATAFKADTFDAKKVAGGKAADGHIAKWGATRRARFLEVAAPVLTPDQRTKLAQQIRDHAAKVDS